MATCFGHPCDHHQANFYRSCAFNVLTMTLLNAMAPCILVIAVFGPNLVSSCEEERVF